MLLDYLRIHIIQQNTFAKYHYRLITYLLSRLFHIHRLIFYMTHAIAAKEGRADHDVFLYRANLDGTDIRLLATSFGTPTPLTIDNNNTLCWTNFGKWPCNVRRAYVAFTWSNMLCNVLLNKSPHLTHVYKPVCKFASMTTWHDTFNMVRFDEDRTAMFIGALKAGVFPVPNITVGRCDIMPFSGMRRLSVRMGTVSKILIGEFHVFVQALAVPFKKKTKSKKNPTLDTCNEYDTNDTHTFP